MADASAMTLCVCVPARNEAARLPILLNALAMQDWPGAIPVAIAINNSTDDSRAVADAARHRHAARLDIRITEHNFARASPAHGMGPILGRRPCH